MNDEIMNDDLNKNGVKREERSSSENFINQYIKNSDLSIKQKYNNIKQNLIDDNLTGNI